VDSSTGVLIKGFTLAQRGPGVLFGIELYDCSNCNVTENVIANFSNYISEFGIPKHFGIGVMISESTNCGVFHNSFINNGQQVVVCGGNGTNFDNEAKGNYWSDYTGWDNNNDGIGDIPISILDTGYNEYMYEDSYPLMSPYGGPPLPMYSLAIASTAWGTTSPLPGNYTHSEGQMIPVQASADSGYVLNHWELDGVNVTGIINPLSVPINSSRSLIAVFTTPLYSVTVESYCQTEGVDVGAYITMDGSFTGYTTPHTFVGLWGNHTFTVPNVDASGHSFEQWSTGEDSTTITVNSNTTCTVVYDAKARAGIEEGSLRHLAN
jgi:hypothetical protein